MEDKSILYPADNIDSNGVAWGSVGENIRRGAKNGVVTEDEFQDILSKSNTRYEIPLSDGGSIVYTVFGVFASIMMTRVVKTTTQQTINIPLPNEIVPSSSYLGKEAFACAETFQGNVSTKAAYLGNNIVMTVNEAPGAHHYFGIFQFK